MDTCSNIGNALDKCAFAREHCDLAAHLQYGIWFYCPALGLNAAAKTGGLILVLFALFSLVGIAAFDFMSPNLRFLATRSGLSQSVIGVTFMAFGNGSVDVFGAMVAMTKGSGTLAIGEIVGAAAFVVGVVLGSIALISSSSVDPIYVKRDASFMLASILIVMVCVYDGRIGWAEACLMVCFYGVYALTVVRQHYAEICSIDAEIAFNEEPSTVSPRRSPCSDTSRSPVVPIGAELMTPLRTSLFSALEFPREHSPHTLLEPPSHRSGFRTPEPQPTGSLSISVNSPPTHPPGSRPPHHLPQRHSSHPTIPHSPLPGISEWLAQDDFQLPDANDQSSGGVSNTPPIDSFNGQSNRPSNGNPMPPEASRQSLSSRLLSPSDLPKLNTSVSHDHQFVSLHDTIGRGPVLSPLLGPDPGPQVLTSPQTSEYSSLYGDVTVLEHLFPAIFVWREREIFAHLVAVLLVVPVFVFAASIPVPIRSSQPSILRVHSVGVPVALTWLSGAPLNWRTALVVGITIGCLEFFTARGYKPSQFILNCIGFSMSIMWVVDLANELLGVLQVFGVVFNISHALLGLTIFAMGDSLGDLVSNIAVVKSGYLTVALSACFGGPIFTLLVGVGGSSLLAMAIHRTGQLVVPVSRSILFTCCVLITMVLVFLLVMPSLSYRLSRSLGLILIALYAINITFSIYLGD